MRGEDRPAARGMRRGIGVGAAQLEEMGPVRAMASEKSAVEMGRVRKNGAPLNGFAEEDEDSVLSSAPISEAEEERLPLEKRLHHRCD